MEVEEYARIAAAEDDHWWYRNTRALMADLLEPWLGEDQLILDAGCGPGGNGAWLADHGRVVGIDLSPDALAFVRAGRPDTTPVRGSLDRLPFATGAFDVAVAITVINCVPDYGSAIGELARVVKPGGAVLVFEPAFEAFRRAHDKTVHSLHRFRRKELVRVMTDHGMTVRRATYLYWFLAPPAAVLGAAERIRPHSNSDAGSDVERAAFAGTFARLAAAERRYLATRDVPIGTTVAVLATRD
jgi:SAM-dependent methyltransferase